MYHRNPKILTQVLNLCYLRTLRTDIDVTNYACILCISLAVSAIQLPILSHRICGQVPVIHNE